MGKSMKAGKLHYLKKSCGTPLLSLTAFGGLAGAAPWRLRVNWPVVGRGRNYTWLLDVWKIRWYLGSPN